MKTIVSTVISIIIMNDNNTTYNDDVTNTRAPDSDYVKNEVLSSSSGSLI